MHNRFDRYIKDLLRELLTVMGRGAVFRRALRELARLPPDAWERQHAAPFLLGLRTEIEEARASDLLEFDFEAEALAAWLADPQAR